MCEQSKIADTLVIIPAYREAGRIGAVIQGIFKTEPNADVLVVDDGSPDETAQEAQHAGALVASHPYNMGYGVALQTGFKYARRHGYQYVVQMDGDGQHEPRCISDLLEAVRSSNADIAMGSRWLGLAEAGVFVAILVLGLVYVWKKGGLEWD